MPHIIILNCLEEPLEILQHGASQPTLGGGSGGGGVDGMSTKTTANMSSFSSSSATASADSTDPRSLLHIAPYQHAAWHKTDANSGTKVHLRCPSTMWSYGCVDLNDLGTFL